MGTTRRELEDYLSANQRQYRQMCCINERSHRKAAYDDLVKIGSEPVPWFCRENNVFIGFEFFGPEQVSTDPATDPSDILTDIKIFRRLEGCL
ncbi:MAG TPA: hypothetical protein VF753_16415 [Terriglobales bacterium]